MGTCSKICIYLLTNTLPYHIVHSITGTNFNTILKCYLAISLLQECHVFTFSSVCSNKTCPSMSASKTWCQPQRIYYLKGGATSTSSNKAQYYTKYARKLFLLKVKEIICVLTLGGKNTLLSTSRLQRWRLVAGNVLPR